MEKRILVKNVIAGVLYLGAVSFIVFIIGMFVFKSVAYIDISGLMIIALIFCCPVVIATFLLVSNAQGVDKRLRIMKRFVIFVFVFYTIILISLLFLNGRLRFGVSYTMGIMQYLHDNANFIPFKTIGNYIKAFFSGALYKSTVIENIAGNLLAFAPMGILLPNIFGKLRNFKTYFITILVILIGVEILQLTTHTGRGDIDDVILNLFGAVIFYGLWRLNVMQKILRKIYIIK